MHSISVYIVYTTLHTLHLPQRNHVGFTLRRFLERPSLSFRCRVFNWKGCWTLRVARNLEDGTVSLPPGKMVLGRQSVPCGFRAKNQGRLLLLVYRVFVTILLLKPTFCTRRSDVQHFQRIPTGESVCRAVQGRG